MMVLSILTDFCTWWPFWAILPAILGWLLGRSMMMKWKTKTEELETDVANWHSKYSSLDVEYNIARKKNTELDSYLSLEKGKFKELNAKYLAYDAKYAELEDLKSSADAKYGTLNAQYKSFDTRYKDLESQHNKLLAKHKAMTDDLEACKAKGKKLQDDLSAGEAKITNTGPASNKGGDEVSAKSKDSTDDTGSGAAKIAGAAGAAGILGASSLTGGTSGSQTTEGATDTASTSEHSDLRSTGDSKIADAATSLKSSQEIISEKTDGVVEGDSKPSDSKIADATTSADISDTVETPDVVDTGAAAGASSMSSSLAGDTSKADQEDVDLFTAGGDSESAQSAEPEAAGEGKWAKLKTNNLEIIEGIGPKMNSILNENGITSWAILAGKSPEALRAVLSKYGDKYKMIEPSDWPKQAAFASNKDWEGLIKYQSDDGSPSKAKSVLTKMGIYSADADANNSAAASSETMAADDGTAGPGKWAKLKTNNHQIIEGIGPKMNQVLIDNGINSWSQLANKSTAELRAMLDKYEDKYRIIDPSDWAKQASFAAQRDWDGLIKHQSDDGSPSKAKKLLVKLGLMKED